MAKISRRSALVGGAGLIGVGGLATFLGLRKGAFGAAVDAYIYGYPLVTVEMTRRRMTNAVSASDTQAPMGQFLKGRRFPDASFRDIPAPNADTLYATAWVDVEREPWILEIPDMGDRYFLFPMLDAWTNVFQSPGTRTTGNRAQRFAITGPEWKGTLPPDVKECHSPTRLVWLLGRLYCSGTQEDYAAVHDLQDRLRLFPLSADGQSYEPPAGSVDRTIDMTTGVRKQVNALDTRTFFTMLADLMITNPPSPKDAPMLDTLARIGVVPGMPIDGEKFDFALREQVPKVALAQIMSHMKFSGGDMVQEGGWAWTLRAGRYGTDYLFRALIAAIGLGANLPADAVYGISWNDASGNKYDGEHRYQIRFAPGKEPPARGFWSITLYDEAFYFAANPAQRYAISPRDHFTREVDGSIVLHIQREPPVTGLSNWLPAPNGPFQLMWRMYWPDQRPPSILDGSWEMPAVTKIV